MPASLDAETRRVVLLVSGFATVIVASFVVKAQFVDIPRIGRDLIARRRRSTTQPSKTRGRLSGFGFGGTVNLFVGCIASVLLMALTSTLLTLPIVSTTTGAAAGVNNLSLSDDDMNIQPTSSASINFCEEDFVHTTYVAEPANTVSSLTSYVPLALLGLIGPASESWRGGPSGGIGRRQSSSSRRFGLAYLTVLAIGLGSAALHALLTAGAQGGDELPMLWFTASCTYCAFDVILTDVVRRRRHRKNRAEKGRENVGGGLLSTYDDGGMLLGVAVMTSAILATFVYVANRDDFSVFYVMFATYAYGVTAGVIWVTFFLDWEEGDDEEDVVIPWGGRDQCDAYRVDVLLPLAVTIGCYTIVGVWTWAFEMCYCRAVVDDLILGDGVAPWFMNRAVHPLWHFESGMFAWLVVQLLLSVHGMRRGWGAPTLRWFGAPYVAFTPSSPSTPGMKQVKTS